jgi:hypothetical protein
MSHKVYEWYRNFACYMLHILHIPLPYTLALVTIIACSIIQPTTSPTYQPKRKRHKLLPKIKYKICHWILICVLRPIQTYVQAIPSNRQRKSQHRNPIRIRRASHTTVQHDFARLVCMSVILSAAHQIASRQVSFDTDSLPIYIDNCSTACVTNKRQHCQGNMRRIRRTITGIGGKICPKIYVTNIKWDFGDDNGVSTTHLVKDGFYIPDAPHNLLSPQHWAWSKNDHYPIRNGTRCVTYDRSIDLIWDQNSHTRTIDLPVKGSNVGVIYTTPSINTYTTFLENYTADNVYDTSIDEPICMYSAFCHEANIQPTDAENELEEEVVNTLDDEQTEQYFPTRDEPLTVDFDLNGPTQLPMSRTDQQVAESDALRALDVNPDKEDALQHDMRHLLILHHRYGHMSFKKLQHMATQGILPKRLAKTPVPLCTACLYGKSTKKPWRDKPTKVPRQKAVITKPGQCVSVDQLVSTTPGYVPQLRGIPTRLRYRVATVFVDQYSDLSFVVNQYSASAEETILAKRKFEEFATRHGVQVKHYHADNGIFADNKFRAAIAQDKQTLSFCGVNSHWQNGKAERRIRELQDHARTMLIHAIRRWPTAINTHLWSLALRYANDMHMHAPMRNGGKTPIERFSDTKVWWNPHHSHTFGCPVYVLDNELQAGKKIPKWNERARVGIFIGHSPEHARTVSLVLSLSSGLTSPQFHCQYDDTFQTVKRSFGNDPPVSKWQKACGFITTSAPRDLWQRTTVSEVPVPTTSTVPVHRHDIDTNHR